MILSTNYLFGMGAWLAMLAMALVGLVRWRQKRRLMRRSLRGPHWGLTIWMFLAALTLPEILCALFYDATDSFSQTNVSRRWFERHVHPNRAGYRDSNELPKTRVAGKQYLTFVGDSFTFGHGVTNVADRFSDRLGVELAGENVVVSNVSLPGVDVLQIVEAQFPEFDRMKLPMDLMVYVFVPNDIEYFDERTATLYQQLASRKPTFFLWKDTYFYNLLYYRVQPLLSSGGGDYYGFLGTSYEEGEPWTLFSRKMNKMHAWCQDRNIDLQVVIFPFLTSLGDDDPFAAAYAKVESHCAAQGIPCLNLTSTMTAHRNESLVVNRYDGHPNPHAHDLAAKAMLPAIRTRIRKRQEERKPHAGKRDD